MAFNSQQYGFWQDHSSNGANEIEALQNRKTMRDPRDYVTPYHPTSWQSSHQHHYHPRYQHHYYEDANSVGAWMDSEQKHYEYYLNTSNQGWSAYFDYGYGEPPQDFHYYPPEQPSVPEQHSSNSGMSLEAVMKSIATNNFQLQQERFQLQQERLQHQTRQLATNTLQFQQETRASLRNLEHQMSQLASSMNDLKALRDLEDDEGATTIEHILEEEDDDMPIFTRSGEAFVELDEIISENPLEEEIDKEPVADRYELNELTYDAQKVLATDISFLADLPKFEDNEKENKFLDLTFLDVYLQYSLLALLTESKEPMNGFLHERKGIG